MQKKMSLFYIIELILILYLIVTLSIYIFQIIISTPWCGLETKTFQQIPAIYSSWALMYEWSNGVIILKHLWNQIIEGISKSTRQRKCFVTSSILGFRSSEKSYEHFELPFFNFHWDSMNQLSNLNIEILVRKVADISSGMNTNHRNGRMLKYPSPDVWRQVKARISGN